jgi:hypothetical protein
MEMLPDEIVIWEGHPTWRATLSFHFKGFLLAVGLTVVLVLLRLAGIDIPIAIIVLVFLAGVGLTVSPGWIHRFFTQYTTKRLNIQRGSCRRPRARRTSIAYRTSPCTSLRSTGSCESA